MPVESPVEVKKVDVQVEKTPVVEAVVENVKEKEVKEVKEVVVEPVSDKKLVNAEPIKEEPVKVEQPVKEEPAKQTVNAAPVKSEVDSVKTEPVKPG